MDNERSQPNRTVEGWTDVPKLTSDNAPKEVIRNIEDNQMNLDSSSQIVTLNARQRLKNKIIDEHENTIISTITKDKVDFDSGIWWEELGRYTLEAPSLTFETGTFPAREFLRLIITIPSGPIGTLGMRFNNDTGSNYANRRKLNDSSDNTAVSTGNLEAHPNFETAALIIRDIWNPLNSPKLIIGETINNSGAGTAAVAPDAARYMQKWHNNAQITSVRLSRSSNNIPAGARIIVLGHD